jgi:hypothetical protein
MAAPAKIDLFKQFKSEYVAKKEPVLVKTGKALYLGIKGKGSPGDEEFTASLGALYGVAYTIKMKRKFDGEQDYVVSKLEGQYWVDGENDRFEDVPRDHWCWKLMIRTPEFVTKAELVRGVAALNDKGKGALTEHVTLETLNEGQCVQILHLGPYEDEHTSIAKMIELIKIEGLAAAGLHHEIYLSDPRRVAPEKLKTIIRFPTRKAR